MSINVLKTRMTWSENASFNQAVSPDQVYNKSVKHARDNILISLNLFLDGNRLVEWIFVMDMQCEALSESHKTRTNMFLSHISPQKSNKPNKDFLGDCEIFITNHQIPLNYHLIQNDCEKNIFGLK